MVCYQLVFSPLVCFKVILTLTIDTNTNVASDAESTETERFIIFDADSVMWGDYQVHVVRHELSTTQVLTGTLKFEIGRNTEEETTSVKLTNTQVGFLALPIGYHSHVCVECGTDQELVELHLSGQASVQHSDL